jgi:CRP/FNR family cyclic AMP-dependent transcriptional regulator
MWPATTEGPPIQVLEADPDLGMGLTAADTEAATKQLVAPTVSLYWSSHRHGWGPPDPSGHFGLLVIAGLLLREVRVLETSSPELLGNGDLLRPWDIDGELDLPVPASICWTVLQPVTVAVLDSNFVRRAADWPEVLGALAGRAVIRAKSMALNDAITNLKRVEVRLLVLFWHLAERWVASARTRSRSPYRSRTTRSPSSWEPRDRQ